MVENRIIQLFYESLKKDRLLLNEPMKNHTSFKVGGNADVLVLPYDKQELIKAIEICKENNVPYYVMGNGSNLIVNDAGFAGVIIKINKNMSKIELLDDCTIRAEAGALLSQVAHFALEQSLTGFEFASGIPGSIGGAVTMNAGAYGREIKHVFYTAEVLTRDLLLKNVFLEDMQFEYRKSLIQKEHLTVVSSTIKLQKGVYADIKQEMSGLAKLRNEKQPMEMPSAGSTFKRPAGFFAGELIMNSGLRGYSVGGAQVSEKHCGFVVNKGNATTDDILNLIEHIITTVKNKFNVVLETEVKII